HDTRLADLEPADAVMNGQQRVGPRVRRFVGNDPEGPQRERFVRLIVEVAHLAPLVRATDDAQEGADGAAPLAACLLTLLERRHERLERQRGRRDGEKRGHPRQSTASTFEAGLPSDETWSPAERAVPASNARRGRDGARDVALRPPRGVDERTAERELRGDGGSQRAAGAVRMRGLDAPGPQRHRLLAVVE